MAIEQFGESLLADVRKRKDDERRRLEKQEQRSAIAALGANVVRSIGNEFLQNQMQGFLQNEQVLAAQAQQKKALSNQANIYSTQKSIEDSGLSDVGYFEQVFRPQFEARAKETLDKDIVGSAGAYESMVTREVRRLAEEQAKAYSQALEAANSLATQEDFNSMLALNAKQTRGTNLVDAGVKGVKRFFTGKTQEDIDQEALLAIQEDEFVDNAEKLNIFMEEYNRTKDLVGSYDFANFVVPKPSEEDLFETKTEIKYVEFNDTVYKQTIEQKYSRNTGEQAGPPTTELAVVDSETSEDFSLDALKDFNTVFNYGKNGRDELTTEGFASFAREAKELGINPEAPVSLTEFRALGKLYNKYTTDENNLRDSFRQDQILNFQNTLISTSQDIQSMVAGFEEDPVKRNQMYQELNARLMQLMKMSESLVTGRISFNDLQ